MLKLLTNLFRRKPEPSPAAPAAPPPIQLIDIGTAMGHDDLVLRIRMVEVQAGIMWYADLAVGCTPETHEEHCARAMLIGEIQSRVLGNRKQMSADDARRVVLATFEHCAAALGIGGCE